MCRFGGEQRIQGNTPQLLILVAQCPLNPSLRFPSSFSVTRLTPMVLSQRSSSDTSSAFTRLPARARFLSVTSDLLKFSCAPSSCDRAMVKVSDG